MDLGQLTNDQISYKHEIWEHIESLNAQYDIQWHQRCKLQWLTEGDENSKFFHHIVAACKRKNRITEILSPSLQSIDYYITDIESECCISIQIYLKGEVELYSNDCSLEPYQWWTIC